ncbi:hypothetical protein LTR17_009240 [Elasticomyces elasticus]|nr:hypothetical protein LTR17_009240 [Elasticomyces elasticus]
MLLNKLPALALTVAAALQLASTATTNCGGDNNAMDAGDILNLISAVNSNNFPTKAPDPILFLALSSLSVTVGSAKLCVTNKFLFESTHDSLTNLAQGAGVVAAQCCVDGSTSCNGGETTIQGDSGLNLVASIRPSSQGCDFAGLDTTGLGAVIADISTAIGNIGNFLEGLFD